MVFYNTEIYINLAMYFPTMVSFQKKYCVEAVLIKFVIFKFFTYDVYRTHTPEPEIRLASDCIMK